MSRILATIPNPTPQQARVLGALRYAFGERRAIADADSAAIQNEYHRRRTAAVLPFRSTARNVAAIAGDLGIALDTWQAEHVASLLSFQNMGAAARAEKGGAR
jgi:hypothetical protein